MPALAENEFMSLNSVPPHIKLAAERALPGAKFNGANVDIGDDRESVGLLHLHKKIVKLRSLKVVERNSSLAQDNCQKLLNECVAQS